MWWPILDGNPVPGRRLDGLGRLVYLIAAMLPMTLLGAYLDRQPSLVYPPYGPPAHNLGVSAVVDQQQAGAIMWVLGSTLMVLGGLWQAMSALVTEERRMQVRERHLPKPALADRGRGK
jgi:cytochrome c oxidase assembly factor CtaG